MSEENARKIFSENLKNLMYENRINQKDLSKIIGVSEATVSDWIKQKKFPRIDKIQIIADYFNVSMSALYTDEPESPDNELLRAARGATPEQLHAAAVYLKMLKEDR